MCEANAYLLKEDGEEELVFENVDRVLPREDGILMEDIFGKKKILRARIKEMALVDHKIFLEAI
ncbi:RNA-binding protein, predicted [Moorella glycerini]|uniref:RNA-binding protein n=1 Tax=Neomoorella stamsii TaxID=1266720 RepID=A0A9X7J2F5_9FIRM|nr:MULTISPECIES: CooT family nickel-binding protein [Moorella]PRR71593.1 putative RNA-binding protein [Moorella stamsii]CEP66150.1 RNA-binding protein, predicted [Moorella glycerini]